MATLLDLCDDSLALIRAQLQPADRSALLRTCSHFERRDAAREILGAPIRLMPSYESNALTCVQWTKFVTMRRRMITNIFTLLDAMRTMPQLKPHQRAREWYLYLLTSGSTSKARFSLVYNSSCPNHHDQGHVASIELRPESCQMECQQCWLGGCRLCPFIHGFDTVTQLVQAVRMAGSAWPWKYSVK